MLWDQLVPTLFKVLRTRCQLDILVLHLGENDLVAYSVVQLLDNLVCEISTIKVLTPKTSLV